MRVYIMILQYECLTAMHITYMKVSTNIFIILRLNLPFSSKNYIG